MRSANLLILHGRGEKASTLETIDQRPYAT